MKTGCPVIGINDSGGARIQEGVVALGLYGEIFRRNVHGVRRHPADLADHGPVRRRRGLLPGAHRLHRDGRQDLAHVHHRPRRHQDRHRRGRRRWRSSAARAPTTPSRGDAHYLGADEDDAIDYVKALLSYLPSNNLDEPPAFDDADADLEVTDDDRELDTLIPDSANQPYDMHTVIEHVVDDGEFLEVQPLFAPNIVVGFGRVEGRSVGIVANQPMQFAGTLDIDASREGRPVRAHLRRVQRPGAHLRRRARLPARHRPGVERHHPPRRQADLRLRRGDRPAGHRDHPQGLRRRLRRHGLQAPRRRHQPRLADRADRGHGRPGRGQHPLPRGARRRRAERRRGRRRGPRRASSPSTRTPWPTPTSPPSAATSTRSSRRRTRGPTSSKALRALRTKRETLPPKKHGNIPL